MGTPLLAGWNLLFSSLNVTFTPLGSLLDTCFVYVENIFLDPSINSSLWLSCLVRLFSMVLDLRGQFKTLMQFFFKTAASIEPMSKSKVA
jgi:hypothetical protein